MLAFLFHSDGSPKVSRQYTSPGRYYTGQDTVRLDAPCAAGERINVIAPYGVKHEYLVIDADDTTALLQRLV